MKYIDNDMDDLFNKAGHEYPLNTDKQNWDAVQKALLEQQSSIPPQITKKTISRYYPLLLLLIPLMYIWFVNDTDNVHPKNQLTTSQNPAHDAGNQSASS